MSYPRIVRRTDTAVSPWVALVEKAVEFTPGAELQTYHCLTQRPYVGMLAQTTEGLIPVVRQYRPAVEEFTWEFPAGTVDDGEDPEIAVRREIEEETGAVVTSVTYLGNYHPDTGRLMVPSYAYYARCLPASGSSTSAEEGLTVKYVTHAELKRMILDGSFRHQLHIAIYGAALVHGIDLDAAAVAPTGP
jgi:ADP-ribose pyrophosphatase